MADLQGPGYALSFAGQPVSEAGAGSFAREWEIQSNASDMALSI